MNIIYASNINSGGGKVLLETALSTNHFGAIKKLYIDSRCDIAFDNFPGLEVTRVKPGVLSRFLAQFNLKTLCSKTKVDQVIFFGNLPPFLKINAKCSIFLQNAYLLKTTPLPKRIWPKVRTVFERILFYRFIDKDMQLMVQTTWMQKMLKKESNFHAELIDLLPQLPTLRVDEKVFDLIAITGPELHKNQKLLLASLKKIDLELSICIVSPSKVFIDNKKISLTHYKRIERVVLIKLLASSSSVIVLSEFESLCLPLYEGKHFGLKILAPKKDYITDHVLPDFEIEELTPEHVNKSIKKFIKSLGRG